MTWKAKLTEITRRPIARLLCCLALAGILTYLFALWSNQGIYAIPPMTIKASPDITETTLTIAGSPGLFHSVGTVSVALSQPYIRSFEKFSLNMSLDGSRWSEIHPHTELPEFTNKSAFTFLVGYVDLTQLNIVIHVRCLLPPQDLHDLPPGISAEHVLNSFEVGLVVHVMTTSKDWIAFLLCWIGVSGFFWIIINALFPTRSQPEST